MLLFEVNLECDNESAAAILKDCLVAWDSEYFEDYDPSLIVEVDELYGHMDDIGEMESLAISIAKGFPDTNFSISGCIDTSESAGEYMDFRIQHQNGKLVSKYSAWYTKKWVSDYEDYDEFTENYGTQLFTPEQFEELKQDCDYCFYRLENGSGCCVQTVPLDYEETLIY